MSTICVQGRLLTDADIHSIRALRTEYPQWSRQRISVYLAEQWQWRNEAGRLKDMAARTLLLKLHARGLIDLPPPLHARGNRQRRARPPTPLQPELLSSQSDPIADPLAALQPLKPILETAIQEQKLERIVLSVDDTRVWRNGKKVPQTQWHRDPLGPAFQTNLRWGHRFLQASLVLPLYKGETPTSSRAIPVRWEMAPVVKKPGKNAEEAQLQEYEREKKEKNLSHQFVALGKEMRGHLNQTGHADKSLSLTVDGSFCNRTVFAHDWEKDKVTIVARCRKDIVLCKRAREKGPRFYGKTKFTPEQVRTRDSLAPWQTAQIFHGGCSRDVRYKEIKEVYWQGGAKKRALRLFVVAPVGYRTSKNGRKYYRQPAYLLTTDLETPAAILLQDYFDRWGIEVNHRDEKEILGVGEAQVWNEKSVTKVPALLVAMYSWLLLAGLACYGPTRTSEYALLPKWRKGAQRPSCLDLVTLLRRQLVEKPIKFPTGKRPPTYETMVQAAAA